MGTNARISRSLFAVAIVLLAATGCATSFGEPTDQGGPVPGLGGPDAGPVTPPGDDPNQMLMLTQSTGVPMAGANVNCRYGLDGPHADTAHYRVIPTTSAPNGGAVVEAILPIEVANSPTGTQSATINLYRLTGQVTNGDFQRLGGTSFEVPNQTLGEVRVPLNVSFGAGDSLVVEVTMADSQQQRNLRFGYNLQPQGSPTYMASLGCGLSTPTDVSTLENPGNPGTTFAQNSWLVSLEVDAN